MVRIETRFPLVLSLKSLLLPYLVRLSDRLEFDPYEQQILVEQEQPRHTS